MRTLRRDGPWRPIAKGLKNDGSYRKVKVLLVDNEGHPLRMQDEKGKPQKYSVIARDGYNAKLPVE